MAMAGVAASVAGGKTVVPHLLDDQVATPKGAPLTGQEADQLKQLMRAVVTEGSARGPRRSPRPGPPSTARPNRPRRTRG
jgi:cell division protein FtsI/penicillin-binding protein 2